MTAEEKNVSIEPDEKDKKQLKALKIGYPIMQLGGGVEKAYFSTYQSYFLTNIYMMSTALSGILTIISNLVGWIGAPLFGIIIDKVSFKKAKFYPWLIIGPIICYVSWMLLYSLPTMGVMGEGTGIIALVLLIVYNIGTPLVTIPASASFPLLSSEPKDRQYFAIAQKVGRDGGKTIMGYVFPALLLALTAASSEINAYMICGLIAGICPIIAYTYYALTMKDSYVERKGLASNKTAAGAKKKVSMLLMFKTVFTNRPLLSMFLFMAIHKGYYFIYVTSATYIFKYVFGDFKLMSIFMTMFNLTAIIGAMLGPIWTKIFKESKRCFVSAMAVHVVIMLVIALTFKNLSALTFIVLFGCSSLFMGLLENWILPMFAASSDYAAWKSGTRFDGITMSIYSLTIKSGTLIATTIRTAILVAAGLDAVKKTNVATDLFIAKAGQLYTWYPLVMGVVALLVLLFAFNLNDERIARINEDLKAGKTAKDSEYKL